ncbi:MAG: class I tRNA ligase family protein, partial [Gammaproteobacteria bacterium]|nr:class I tRNA ligase family protein [Gammaproteobacteria bacterium]
VLRLWVASTDYAGEMSVSDEILKRMSDAYRRLRNTARFLLANLKGFEPARDTLPPEALLALDRWAVDRAWRLQQEVEQAYRDYQFHVIYQKVHNFCAVDLGAFYPDIIKDRQYTTQADSRARRSAQTAMYHIIEALVRWLAPILSFTAEEIWQHIPGGREESVFLATWYEGLYPLAEETVLGRDFWARMEGIRDAVNKELERLRNEGAIGSGLDAEVALYADAELAGELEALGEELRFVLITSEARVLPAAERTGEAVDADELDGLWILARRSGHEKCVRCWHRRADVGADADHPELCGRCVENVAGAGEQRRFA